VEQLANVMIEIRISKSLLFMAWVFVLIEYEVTTFAPPEAVKL
jgi:hypothetical protein